ncbi:hypothetical protein VNO77_02661 [Canavalia gladiata]|uniref:Uncharacterized protein n=1 Tax=Canavalia gladiata TaxID=3824 RepID=A0AAN9MYM0_CANGL
MDSIRRRFRGQRLSKGAPLVSELERDLTAHCKAMLPSLVGLHIILAFLTPSHPWLKEKSYNLPSAAMRTCWCATVDPLVPALFSFLDPSCGCQFSLSFLLRLPKWWQASARSHKTGTSTELACANRGDSYITRHLSNVLLQEDDVCTAFYLVPFIRILSDGLFTFRRGDSPLNQRSWSLYGNGELKWSGRIRSVRPDRSECNKARHFLLKDLV